jgi:hypothetical protein
MRFPNYHSVLEPNCLAPDLTAQSEALGQEIRLYDPRRRPSSWSKIIQPHQCAVFLRDTELGVAVGRDCAPRGSATGTCILFDAVADAEAFCRGFVTAHPQISCEILDSGGPANPPLITITHQHSGGDDDTRGWIAGHRRWVITVLIAAALPLFWYDWIHEGSLVLTIVGINLIVAAARLLLWDLSAKSNERERLARLEAHRQQNERKP